MATQLLLVALSLMSLTGVRWMLAQPYRHELHPVFVPNVLAIVPDATQDWRGLV